MKIQNRKIIEAFAKVSENKENLLESLKFSSEKDVTLKSIHRLIQSEATDRKIRQNAVSLLFDIRSKKSTNVLLQCFMDEDQNIAHIALLALSTMPSDKALNFMTKILDSSPDEEKRADAAYILRGYFDNERAMSVLANVLNDKSQSVNTRANAAESLGMIGDNRHTKILAKYLENESIEVAFWCIYALWQVCMDVSVIPKLERFIGNKTVIDKMFIVEEEAKAAIRYIEARTKVLTRLGITDTSKDTYWKIYEEVQKEVKSIEEKNGEFYKDMSYFRKNSLINFTDSKT